MPSKPINSANKPTLLKAPFTRDQALAAQKAWADYHGTSVEFTNSVGMKFRMIPPGEFLMGSEKSADEVAQLFNSNEPDYLKREHPRHIVQLTNLIAFQTTEVTQAQWKSIMHTRPWKGEIFVANTSLDDYPATHINWNDATMFCLKLSEKEGRTYRLPTEAEWEYACRAGTTSMYCFGNNLNELGDYAWYKENGKMSDKEEEIEFARRVGLKRPNHFGLYDLHGNVYEWCSDWFDTDYYSKSPLRNPKGPMKSDARVLRGGAFIFGAISERSAARFGVAPNENYTGLCGFRVVVE